MDWSDVIIAFAKSDLAILPNAIGELTIEQYLLLTQKDRKVKCKTIGELKAWESWAANQRKEDRSLLKAEQAYRYYAGYDALCETPIMHLELGT